MSIDLITIDSKIMAGQPCIRDTRIPVVIVLKLLARQDSFHMIITDYPQLTAYDIEACLNFAVWSLQENEAILKNKKVSWGELIDEHTRTMERRIRALETERQLLEVQRNKLEEARDNLKLELQKLRQPPLFVGTIHSLLDNGKAIVKSSTGTIFAVVVDSSIPRDLLIPGAQVLLHQRNFAILEVIPKNEYSDLGSLREQLADLKTSVEILVKILNNQKSSERKGS